MSAHELVHHRGNNFTMFGGITLNRQIGGINPSAVESSLKLGGKIVWLPTTSARNHMVKMVHTPDGCVEVVRDGKIVPELKDVFRLVRDFDVILATGHISPEECFTVVEAARAESVKKIVVTHPEWWSVGMSLADQLRLVKDYAIWNAALPRTWATEPTKATYPAIWRRSRCAAIGTSLSAPTADRWKIPIGRLLWSNTYNTCPTTASQRINCIT